MEGSAAQDVLVVAIRKDLLDRGITQQQLADELGVSLPTLTRILGGIFPGRFVAHKVASRYKLKPSEVWPIGAGDNGPESKEAA